MHLRSLRCFLILTPTPTTFTVCARIRLLTHKHTQILLIPPPPPPMLTISFIFLLMSFSCSFFRFIRIFFPYARFLHLWQNMWRKCEPQHYYLFFFQFYNACLLFSLPWAYLSNSVEWWNIHHPRNNNNNNNKSSSRSTTITIIIINNAEMQKQKISLFFLCWRTAQHVNLVKRKHHTASKEKLLEKFTKKRNGSLSLSQVLTFRIIKCS